MPTPTFALGSLLAADLVASNLQLGLFTGPTLTGQAVAYADIVEPTFPGYARKGADSWQDAEVLDEDLVVRRSEPVEFRATGTSSTPAVRGWFVSAYDGTQNVIVDMQEFKSPRAMTALGANINLQVELQAVDDGILPS